MSGSGNVQMIKAGGLSIEAHLVAVAARALPEHVTQLDHLLRFGFAA